MSNPNQARKNAARKRRERTGEGHQAAVRATQEPPAQPVTRWVEDPSLEAPERTVVFEVEQSGADSDGWDPDDPYGDVEEYERS